MNKNREDIKKGLILLYEQETLQGLEEDGVKGKRADALIISARKKDFFKERAESTLVEYENHLINKLSQKIGANLKNDLGIEKSNIDAAFNGLEESVSNNHNSLKSVISDLELSQNLTELHELENEVKRLTILQCVLKEHKASLGNLAKKEANKISWIFFAICTASVLIWGALIYYLGWDRMEKWTYLSALILIAFNAAYYAIFEKRLTSENLRNEKYNKRLKYVYSLYKYNDDYLKFIEDVLGKKNDKITLMKEKLPPIKWQGISTKI